MDGGTSENDKVSYKFYDDYEFTEAYKEHYIFDGWYSDKNFTNKISNIKYHLFNKDVYAKFTPEEYSIEFFVDEEKKDNDIHNYRYNEKEILLPRVSKEHYIFKGWQNDGDNPIFFIPKGTYGNKKFNAVFEAESYKLNYITNGGCLNEDVDKIYSYGTSMKLPTPSKKGYTFSGWYLDDDLKEKIIKINEEDFGNKTLYASWVKNQTQNNAGNYSISNSSDGWRISSGVKVGNYQSGLTTVDLYDYDTMLASLNKGAIRSYTAGGVEYIGAHASHGFNATLSNNTLYIKREDGTVQTYNKVSTHYGDYNCGWVATDGTYVWGTYGGDLLTQTCTDCINVVRCFWNLV